jgi:ABC-2 type transport system ATP-binding protein
VQLAGPADDLIAAHRLLTVPRATTDAELPGRVIHRSDSDRHSAVLVRADPVHLAVESQAGWQADPVGFEQLVMAYLQRPPGAAWTENPETTKAATR